MNRRLSPMTAALLAVFAAPLAFQATATAQTAQTESTLPEISVHDSAESDSYAPGMSTVGGKTPTAVRDIPQSVTIINRAVLDAQNATTLTEALRNVPGITLAGGEGGAIGDNINIRGFSARTDLFVDGMRDRGQYARETFFLESVEVLKGPSSMLFGRGSTGGVINQVSKQPSLRELNEVGLSVGSEDYYRATVDFNRPLSDTSAFRVSGLAHTNKSTRDVVESERYGIAPSLKFGIGTPTEITLSSFHQRRNDVPDLGFPMVNKAGNTTGKATKEDPAMPINRDFSNFYGFTDDKFKQEVDAVEMRVKHKFSPDLTLLNQTRYSTARIDAQPSSINYVNADEGKRVRKPRSLKDQSLFNQTDLIAKFETAGMKHTLITGVELGREEYEEKRFASKTETGSQSLFNPVYGPFVDYTPTQTRRNDNSANTFALYANDTLELNKQWKLVGGLRWDRFDYDGSTIENGATENFSQVDKMWSKRLGVLYQPTDTQSYYASFGTSFNPSTELVSLRTADVKPEKNRSFEVGGKWDLLDGRLALNSAIFRVEKKNAVSADPITGEATYQGETRVDGFELGAAGKITKDWDLFGGYTYLDGKIVSLNEDVGGAPISRTGNTLENTPEHSATLWTTYRLGGGWEIGGGAVYSSERLLNSANTAKVDSYTRYDATVAYLTKQYDFRINLMNLSDKKYFESAARNRSVPADGRAIVASVNYRF